MARSAGRAGGRQLAGPDVRAAGRAQGGRTGSAAGYAAYLLRAEADEVDAGCFEALLARGRQELASGDAQLAADHLRAALALWRGPPLAGPG
jgi:hypothetical protein